MTEIDHKAEALLWANNAITAQTFEGNETLATAYATIAQTHADLAIAEQMRVANLVAIAGLTFPNGYKQFLGLIIEAIGDYGGKLNPEIAKALGVKQ